MKCMEMGEYLMDLAAGIPAKSQVEEHLHSCPACAEHLESLRNTMTLLDEWEAPEPSPYFDVRLNARLREETARSRGWLAWFRKPALAAAMVALLVLGGLLYTGPTEVKSPPPTTAQALPGTAVGDLQILDKNHELLADFDLLDDVDNGQTQGANP